MTNLQQRQKKIQDKRKKTPWRKFIKDIASWKVVSFYKHGGITSKFPETQRVQQVMKPSDYEEYRDTLTDKGVSYISGKDFFKQFASLFQSITLPSVIHFQVMDNCDYADVVSYCRNCYLSFWPINNCEFIMYSDQVKDNCSYVFNSMMVWDNSENIYTSRGILQSYAVFYSQYLFNCNNIWFSSSLVGCTECILCHDLENVSYCIDNKQYTKEEYLDKKQQLLSQKNKFIERYGSLEGKGLSLGSTDCEGTHILESQGVTDSRLVYQIKHGRNLFLVGGTVLMEEVYDNISTGPGPAEHIYGLVGAGNGISHVYNSCHIAEGCHNVYYSYFLTGCSYCLGCIGLKNKEFCILNKQYTKDEWHQKVNEIFKQMEQGGVLGDFFPASMNPFYFNDTAASLIEDFTKEEVEAEGYLWRDEEIAVDIPAWMEVVEVSDLGQYEVLRNGAREIDPAILKKVIRNEEGNVYRVVKIEYDFLMKYGLPLPRKHWLDRLKGHFRVK